MLFLVFIGGVIVGPFIWLAGFVCLLSTVAWIDSRED